MLLPSPAEVKELIVSAAFQSDAFIVAKGEKTQTMKDIEAEKAAHAMAARQSSGLPQSTNALQTSPNPDPAPPPVVEKLAGVLKFLIQNDPVLLAKTKIEFKKHFTGVLTKGKLILEPLCDSLFDSASAEDITYKELRKLGMHRGGQIPGVETLGRWIRSEAYSQCVPNGPLTDDYVSLIVLLTLDPELLKGKLEWDDMNKAITINREPIDLAKTVSRIRTQIGDTYSQEVGRLRKMRRIVPSHQSVEQALEALAKENPFHATKEWMDALPAWDGVDRMLPLLKAIRGWVDTSAIDMPQHIKEEHERINNLALKQLTKTLIGTVARTYEPGCQMDTMLVLKSKQGTKKSTLFRVLAPAGRFSASHGEFGTKDSRMVYTKNTWVEIAELSGMQRKEIQTIKAEISDRSDDFRPPYAKAIINNPRWCVLVGSTNDDKFLKDQSGSRRFWIIVIGDDTKADMVFVENNKPQLWAQAVALYKAAPMCQDCLARADGETRCPTHRWWLTDEEDSFREKYNENFTEVEPYVEALRDWMSSAISDRRSSKQGLHTAVKNTDHMTVAQFLQEVIMLPPEKVFDRIQQDRMARALKICGYTKKHTEHGNIWISPGMRNRPDLKLVAKEKTEAVSENLTKTSEQ